MWPAGGLPAGERYPYGSPAFEVLVADSYAQAGSAGVQPFTPWFAQAFARYERRALTDALDAAPHDLAAQGDPTRRVRLELQAAVWIYGVIKTTIPRFSLDRGYEFANVVRFGERQCLLQSVLLASLLQAMGLDAGVYMVWQNPHGEVSNNGHAVTVLKLSDGRDVLVDASEREPFSEHQGVFLVDRTTGRYRFVHPRFNADATIGGYQPESGGGSLAPAAVRPLDVTFLRSQFYYYRGERVPDGVLGRSATPDGLAASARYLEHAQTLDPANPLAVYMLGTVYRRQGRFAAARIQYARGYRLYQIYGFVPDGPKTAFAQSAY